MNANKFAIYIARIEGKEKPVNIAQIKEILAIIHKLLIPKGVDIYKIIK